MVTVGFSTTGKVISWIIRLVTRGRCSHAWVAFYDETLGVKLVAQAETWGVELRPWPIWSRDNRLIAEYTLDVPLERLRHALRSLPIGSPYDYVSGFWAGVGAWLRRWRKSRFSLRPARTPGKLMCAELQARFLIEAGIDLPGVDVEAVAPSELCDILDQDDRARLVT